MKQDINPSAYQYYESDAEKSQAYFRNKQPEPLNDDLAKTAFELMELGLLDNEIAFDMDIPVQQVSLMRDQSIFRHIAKQHDYPIVLTEEDLHDRVYGFITDGDVIENLTVDGMATWLGVPIHVIHNTLLKLGLEPVT